MSTNENEENIAKLCIVCKLMYGNQTFQNMCSKCFKDSKSKDKKYSEKTAQILKKQETTCELDNGQKIGIKEQQKQTSKDIKQQIVQQLAQKQKKQEQKTEPQKCCTCKRKVGILGYACKHCKNKYCKLHRLPEDHDCQVDFVALGKQKLIADNPAVFGGKIQQI